MALNLDTTLRDHSFVAGFSEQQLSELSALATEVAFEENEIILADREHSSGFFFVTSGSVAVELSTARYAVCVQAVGAGQVFGWSSLLDRQDTLFQVRARERTTAFRIAAEDLKALCRRDPLLGIDLLQRTLQVVASRVRATEERFAEMCGVRVTV